MGHLHSPKPKLVCTRQNGVFAFYIQHFYINKHFLVKNVQLHPPRQISGYATGSVNLLTQNLPLKVKLGPGNKVDKVELLGHVEQEDGDVDRDDDEEPVDLLQLQTTGPRGFTFGVPDGKIDPEVHDEEHDERDDGDNQQAGDGLVPEVEVEVVVKNFRIFLVRTVA